MKKKNALIKAENYLTQRPDQHDFELIEVDSNSIHFYHTSPFVPENWFVFCVSAKSIEHMQIGASEHIAVNKDTGEVKSLGLLGE